MPSAFTHVTPTPLLPDTPLYDCLHTPALRYALHITHCRRSTRPHSTRSVDLNIVRTCAYTPPTYPPTFILHMMYVQHLCPGLTHSFHIPHTHIPLPHTSHTFATHLPLPHDTMPAHTHTLPLRVFPLAHTRSHYVVSFPRSMPYC